MPLIWNDRHRAMCCDSGSALDERSSAGIVTEGAEGPGVVEVGAGTGYWGSLLRNRGVDVICYDRWVCFDDAGDDSDMPAMVITLAMKVG